MHLKQYLRSSPGHQDPTCFSTSSDIMRASQDSLTVLLFTCAWLKPTSAHCHLLLPLFEKDFPPDLYSHSHLSSNITSFLPWASISVSQKKQETQIGLNIEQNIVASGPKMPSSQSGSRALDLCLCDSLDAPLLSGSALSSC